MRPEPRTAARPGGDDVDLRQGVRALCLKYPAPYWRELDRGREYPADFVSALTEAGYMGALIPEEYGGLGLGIGSASTILEEIARSGGNPAAVHAQMYIMGTLLRHGSQQQKRSILPRLATEGLRLQAFAVTEPTVGSETTNIQTTAIRDGDSYVIRGQKVFTSRVLQSDFMLLLARTTPRNEVTRRSDGLSVFLLDLKAADSEQLTVRPIETMMNHHSNEVFFDNLRIPSTALIGDEGKGFKYILDGMNAERVLIAAECIGDARYFVDRAVEYAGSRVVFGRPIGINQGVQFPLAKCHARTEAADLMRWRAANLFDSGHHCGPQANMALLLAAEASWDAANAAIQTFGGYGFAVEYDIERKFRETRLYQVAPVSTNLILSYIAERVLGLPRSY